MSDTDSEPANLPVNLNTWLPPTRGARVCHGEHRDGCSASPRRAHLSALARRRPGPGPDRICFTVRTAARLGRLGSRERNRRHGALVCAPASQCGWRPGRRRRRRRRPRPARARRPAAEPEWNRRTRLWARAGRERERGERGEGGVVRPGRG